MKFLGSTFVAMFIIACNNKQPQIVEPPCIADQVIYFSENEACDSGASVLEYEFQKEVVYVFNHGECIADHASVVVNYDCDTLGFLKGLAGVTEINGKDFYNHAESVRTLFEN
ncbi:MAG: hypothetical protein P8I55_06950 [Crocinitomix sp.]|nr:hypothetical protein [Crocinitomix sp.]